MPIEGFDYKAFAMDLTKQAIEVFKQPDNKISQKDAKIIVNSVQQLCTMAGQTLDNDKNKIFNADQAKLIVQFVGEYTFHKFIDMINGKVPEQARASIINAIVGALFAKAKLAIIKKLPDEQLLSLIDKEVQTIYAQELQKLIKKGIMTQEQYEVAVKMSNLDNMVKQNVEQAKAERVQNAQGVANAAPASTPPNDKKVLKLASLAILLKKLPKEKAEIILSSLSKDDVMHIMNYMKMSDLESKIDHSLIIKSLGEIKQILPEPENVNVEKILKNYRKTLKTVSPDVLSDIAMYERENVKEFILDTRFPATGAFSPFVIQSLVKTIEDKINDY